MFEMTTQQQKAFQDAAGVSATTFSHVVLFTIGIFATIWLFLILIGTWHEIQSKHIDFGDALGKMAFAIFIYIGTGALIFY